jgi:hypothetical protein
MHGTAESEKICPECEEDMDQVHDKNKKLIRWECSECGKKILVSEDNKEKKP